MTPAEVDRLLEVIGETHRLYALYFVALATGMRQAELIGLRWRNVQLIEKDGKPPHIRIREEIRQVKGKPTPLPPKSKHSKRDIWPDPLTITVLQVHRVMHFKKALKRAYGLPQKKTDWSETHDLRDPLSRSPALRRQPDAPWRC
jgi:integrase